MRTAAATHSPLDRAKRPLDRAGVRAAPHGEPDQDRGRDEDEDQASRAASRQPGPLHAAALTASAGAASRS